MPKDPNDYPPKDVSSFWKISIRNKSAKQNVQSFVYFCLIEKIEIYFRITKSQQALFWATDEETENKLRECMLKLHTKSTYHSNPHYQQRGNKSGQE